MSDRVKNDSPKAPALTAESLPLAVGNLFAINNYDVVYDVNINGAQVDLIATAKSDPFSSPIYIETTIEYVRNDKYAKDATKFLLIREKFPDAKLLCVSSLGFTAEVAERALNSRVEAMTYRELFARFEKFSDYVNYVLSDISLSSLATTYEEPFFQDSKGHELVSSWIKRWKAYTTNETKWLIVLGEYGTGKRLQHAYYNGAG